MRVLIADDDEDIRFMVTMLMDEEGWDVTTTSSGREAVELLNGTQFDALVLDLNMPPGSGLEVLEARRSAGDTTPTVLFSGFVTLASREVADRLNATILDKTNMMDLTEVVARTVAECSTL